MVQQPVGDACLMFCGITIGGFQPPEDQACDCCSQELGTDLCGCIKLCVEGNRLSAFVFDWLDEVFVS